MITINPNKAGLVVGLILGGWHLLWALLVAVGLAQMLVDFIFWIHFFQRIIVVESFDIVRALILVAVTAAIGYVIGFVFGMLWNRLHK
jgi:hypothetical protein